MLLLETLAPWGQLKTSKKIFHIYFYFFATHTIRQLFFAITFPDSEIKFFTYTFTAA